MGTEKQETAVDCTGSAQEAPSSTEGDQNAMEREAMIRYEVELERRREVFGERI